MEILHVCLATPNAARAMRVGNRILGVNFLPTRRGLTCR